MPALVAGIHALKRCNIKDADGRNKSGHDRNRDSTSAASCPGSPLSFRHSGTARQRRTRNPKANSGQISGFRVRSLTLAPRN